MERVRNLDEVKHWLSMGGFNSKLIYHVGILCNDAKNVAFSEVQDEVGQIRALMLKAFNNDEVHLFQKRVGNVFDYIAIKRSKERYRKHDDRFKRVLRIARQTDHAETSAVLSDQSVPEAYEYGRQGYSEDLGRCATGAC